MYPSFSVIHAGLLSSHLHHQHLIDRCSSLGSRNPQKPIGKKFLGRPRLRWKDNNIMDIKEIGVNTKNWIDLTQDRDFLRALVNAALNLWVL
jgi:hypothetical protein